MTGMDMLLASLTQEQLVERAQIDAAVVISEELTWDDVLMSEYLRWIIEDLERRTRE